MVVNGVLIERIYQVVMKRVFRWVLPSTILFSYLTAWGLKESGIYNHLKRIELITLHYLTGIALTTTLTIISYHFCYKLLSQKKNSKQNLRLFFWSTVKIDTFGKLIDVLFYTSLVISCITGLSLFLSKYTYLGNSISYNSISIIIHELFSWLFLSVVILKYYLFAIKYYEHIISYLREF